MKKLCVCLSMSIAIIVVIPVMAMQLANKNLRGITFDGGIVIPYYTFEKIGASFLHYNEYRDFFDSGAVVPLFPRVSSKMLSLVKDSMNIEIDKFDNYYNNLSVAEKECLINVSGWLHIPQLISQLIKINFPGDIYKKIDGYFEQERRNVSNFFKSRIITNKSSSFNVDWFNIGHTLCRDINYKSIWMTYDYITSYQNDSIPLYINGIEYDTYATYFATDTHEYRLTNKKDNTCSLWVIDHDNLKNSKYTFSISIKHQKPIKGSCFSKLDTGHDCIVTFSESDIFIVKITRDIAENNIPVIKNRDKIKLNNEYEIVDVSINAEENHLVIGAYDKQELRSIITVWKTDKDCLEKTFSFKNHGLLERVFIVYNKGEVSLLNLLFCVGGDYKILQHQFVNNDYLFPNSFWCRLHSNRRDSTDKDGYHIYVNDNMDSFLMYDADSLDSMKGERFNKTHHIYSPDGNYLLCNSFKKKLGCIYIETILKDAISHATIYCKDTFLQVLNSLIGLGFSKDESRLVFLNSNSTHNTFFLLNNDEENNLSIIKNKMSSNIIMTLIFKQLCERVKKYTYLKLDAQDPSRRILINLAKISEDMLSFLEKYLPLAPDEKKIDYSFANFSKLLFGPEKSNLSNSFTT